MKEKKILMFSRDPGGTNAVMQLIAPLRALKYEVAVFGKDAALSIYRRHNQNCLDIREAIPSGTQEETNEFVRRTSPDLVLTGTSSEDFTERRLWKAAKKAGIASFAVLDQWTNYRLRLIHEGDDPVTGSATSKEMIMTSVMFIMDEFSKKEMCMLGIDDQRLVVTGQPFFDYIRQAGSKFARPDIEKLRRELTGGQDGLLFVFASQPIASTHRQNGMAEDYWGYTEKTILKSVAASLVRLAEELKVAVTLVLRLHPKDEPDAYRDVLTTCSGSTKIVFDRETDSSLLLKAADLIIGMFSMVLLEAAILERPFISVQIGLKRENPLIFDRMGVSCSILTQKDLEVTLRQILNGKGWEGPELKFEFGATERIIEYLGEYK